VSVANDFQYKLKKFSKQAKDTFDCAKLEIKIKNYGRECKKRYTRIGALVYESKKKENVVNGDEIEIICKEIDKFKHKIKITQKQIDEIKSVSNVLNYRNDKNNDDVVKDKDNNDNTNKENVKLLKFCPKCNVGNEPSSKLCAKCGYEFE